MASRKITHLVVAPSGDRAVSLDSAGELLLWDARTCALLGPVPRPGAPKKGASYLLAWHPVEGALLLVEGGDVVLRDPASGAVTRRWKAHDQPAVMAAASLDAGRVWTATKGTLRLWDVAAGAMTGTRVARYSSPIRAVALGSHPTRCTLLWKDYVDHFDFADRGYGSSSSHTYHRAASMDIEPGSRWFVIGGHHGNLLCWELDAKFHAQARDAHAVPVSAVLVLPGSQAVLSASSDGVVKRWSLADGMHLENTWEAPQPVTAAARIPSGGALLGGQRGGVFRAPWA